MKIDQVKFDCKYFKGHIPCSPNKKHNVVCDDCNHYKQISKRILVIKLAAIGDVIRTTPLIEKYSQLYPNAHFTWVTLFPDVLPSDKIDVIYKLDAVSILNITNSPFDIAINLDKDIEACSLLSTVKAKEKYGYTLIDGHVAPATPKAEHKIITGLFDSISQQNKKSYLEEIFEICHLEFNYEEYSIRTNSQLVSKWREALTTKSKGKKVVGLNTGCGERWKTRLWSEDRWIELAKQIQDAGYFCILLGGAAEEEKNLRLAQKSGAYYPGNFSLEEFIALTNSCNLIITQVSLMMHIAIALKKQMILFNNIFNPHEFELYGRGAIMQPTSGCDCYYGNSCKREVSCMNDINVDDVFANIQKYIGA